MRFNVRSFGKALMEVAWLAAVAAVPLFFNFSSAQTFEPDKMFLVRLLAIFASAAWLLTRIDLGGMPDRTDLLSFLRIPLMKPILFLALAFIISSLFSIIPSMSWLGSYQRAQGTIALLCYIILFLIIAAEMRKAIQLERFKFILVLTSVPVAIYALLQSFGLDPLSWKGIANRSAGTIGNPIYLGGYLVMVLPLTFSRIIEGFRLVRRNSERKPGIAMIGGCSFALILQLGALFSTQSRGPLAALIVGVYICIFIGLVLHRSAEKGTLYWPFIASGIGLAVPIFLLTVVRLASSLSTFFCFSALACFIAAIGTAYFFYWRTALGRSWLWLTWLCQLISILLIVLSISSGMIRGVSAPSLGRISHFSDPVRKALWESSIRYVKEGAPAAFSDGTKDRFHNLRVILGYGPECIWIPGNLKADPSYVKYLPESPIDRMHNEVFDNFISVGLIGSAAFLFLVAAALFFSLKLLGFDFEGRNRSLYIICVVLGILAGIAIPWAMNALYMVGIGVELGLLLGVLLFVAISGFTRNTVHFELSNRHWIVLAILGGLIAHLIETGLAIAVSTTRVYFFLYLGVIAAFSLSDFEKQNGAVVKGHNKKASGEQNPMLPYAALTWLVVLMPSWFIIFNIEPGLNALEIFQRSWFSSINTWAALAMIFMTIGVSNCLMIAGNSVPRTGRVALGKMLGIVDLSLIMLSLLVGVVAAEFWIVENSFSVALVVDRAESRVTWLGFCFVLSLFVATALLMRSEASSNTDAKRWAAKEWITGVAVTVAAVAGIWSLSVCPAWADIACRAANAYKNVGNFSAAAQLYARATSLAPRQSAYWSSLGLAQASSGSSLMIAESSIKTALELNRFDPMIYRTFAAIHEQLAERAVDPDFKRTEVEQAISYFQKQGGFSPNYPDADAQIGRCYVLLGDYRQAQNYFARALKKATSYFRTYLFMGEMYFRQKELQKALDSYRQAVRWDRQNLEVRKNVGLLLALLNRKDEAIGYNIGMLRDAPRDPVLLRRLAVLYFGKGDYSSGFAYAEKAYEADKTAGKPGFEQFIEDLKNQSSP